MACGQVCAPLLAGHGTGSDDHHEALMCTSKIALADPVFDPRRQISGKVFWMLERLISAIGME
jgi:hypothetical protein